MRLEPEQHHEEEPSEGSDFGYAAVTGQNEVAVMEMESLEVEKSLQVGKEPMGLIVL